jgi:RsiW-degrading membrane proteinase PrsW (M82 family)
MAIIGISLAPVILLIMYIYYRDKYEKEPKKMLAKALLFGALTVIPILFVETWISNYWVGKYDYPSNKIPTAAYNAFVVASFTEELFKYLVFILIIWRNKNFNERFDGIVYAAFISLGFAAVENILYVVSNGMGVGIIRAFTAVPAHAMFGIAMGYYFGKAGFIGKNRSIYLFAAFLIPFILHGVYDFVLMAENNILLLLFVPILIIMVIVALNQMKHLSKTTNFNPEVMNAEKENDTYSSGVES